MGSTNLLNVAIEWQREPYLSKNVDGVTMQIRDHA